jgi:hypothetical protein
LCGVKKYSLVHTSKRPSSRGRKDRKDPKAWREREREEIEKEKQRGSARAGEKSARGVSENAGAGGELAAVQQREVLQLRAPHGHGGQGRQALAD